ncbi:IclR family transcriptional regulator [Actinomadura rugatobispora]|uniref:IclR family transcriptional regulator n=1 Tax=Actinomadura rugatobispora TaxID=1994 RepID=A0ABW1AA69_9ACTN|nr:IclR family transcriptional regulator [Actinomadura rugatobispora]
MLQGAFAVLQQVATRGEAGLSELAAATGVPKATVHRLLDQLVGLGIVHRGPGGRYRVGVRAFCLGQAWDPAPVLRSAAAAPVRRLAAATGDSVCLAVMESADAVTVAGMFGRADEVISLRPGEVLPPATATEAVISAARPALTVPRGSSRAEWGRRVRYARDHGYAFDLETTAVPVACVAAPVRAPGGTVVAAVGVVVLEPRRLRELAAPVRDTADKISANLGRVPGAGRVLAPLAGMENC